MGGAFDGLRRSGFDFETIVWRRGIAAVSVEDHSYFREWLLENGYEILTFDFSVGRKELGAELDRHLHWEDQFGYPMPADGPNPNALHDGFNFDVPEAGLALEILGAETLWLEDPEYLIYFLTDSSDHSMEHLAYGRRLLTLLSVPKNSTIFRHKVEAEWLARTLLPHHERIRRERSGG